jgi:WD40 repeat protein
MTALAICIVFCGAVTRPQPVTACAFAPGGASLVVAHHGSVVVRSVADGREERCLDIKLDRISALAFDPTGQLLAVAGGVPGASGSVVLWDWKTNSAVGELGGFQDLATAVAFSADGSRIAIASADKTARIDQLTQNGRQTKLLATLKGHAGPVFSIIFSPDGDAVLTASADRSLKLWDSQSGQLVRTFTNHTDAVHCLASRPVVKAKEQAPWAVASGGDDKTVRVWQPTIGRMVRIVRKHEGAVFALTYSHDGSRLFSAGAEGIVRIITADSDEILGEFKAHYDWIYTLAVSDDGRWLAAGDWSGEVRMWDLRTMPPRRFEPFQAGMP